MSKLALSMFLLTYIIAGICAIILIVILSAMLSGTTQCMKQHAVDACYITFTPEKR